MSTAIVVSQRSAYMRALMSNVARVTGITEELSPDEKRARIEEAKSQGKRPVLTLSTKEKADRSLERFVREADNPDMPYVVLVTLRPIRSRDGDEVVFNETHVSIPDPKCPSEKVSVPARVHLMVNGKGGVLPYFGVQPIVSDDETTATTYKYVAKAHWCFLLKPRGRDRHYRLAPLALGTSALFRWNLIAKTKQGNAQADQLELVQKDWPVIEPFDHCLELPENFRGRDLRNLNLYLEYQPTCYQPSNESHADSKRMYGTIFGQKVIDLSDGSVQRVPAADKLDAEGNPCFGEHVFRIFEITESSLVVLWDGAVGISTIRPQESMKFDKLHMNGFEALNLNELDADPLTVMTRAMRLATGSLDKENSLYLYALASGSVEEDWDANNVRPVLRMMAKEASEYVQNELREKHKAYLDKFSTAILPTLEEALAGVDIVEVWYRSSGDDDVVANWIGERIEGEFRFDSWLHTRVRTEVLRMIASKDGVSPPARPKKEKAEEPKTQVVVPPANAAPPAEEAAPAEAVKPKRARKPGKSKKDASASSPA
ncbi:hypothetical protein A3C09_00870 [Candidatus Uhrbacteria bacterium RIFCSPHIGHO2_02_FULL_47_44]|uniref:Uncharacterized protein n=1 Tax=Candidatus Uhrbacteria bacterium RIFCSPLOWO2_02_FULL_48_18 TaxID=1802408 RepID=A0A1F7VDG6_9BACT|nr:MAG: hypothetical protein A2839_04115 [Candidatus Uhrbacteria bacterium RIFCSPHIGHO2_01_FULL_47_10]OGL71507.1 MAG: hypothetical protein A3C09_00870 [Candidatus Uhrbacteria bacterium RIFCSPHIGHO2_02_FULL_47_44]OGL77686.1 MAG: hypothetical protein A3E97_04095 [Candidatus Uhrbacteria bacterium RIFCSPHIGHO2_12_FULL_47_12]OGL82381.1 MAG: hypothetical protein A3B20_01350 [Candidatus Uhrbacteria bacterium RIFCSPLOWO2_01_FULL_47_17]OGL88027.1 MAG: hypothetical protein A3I41_02880 [Candidatus Uhrbact